MDKKRERGKNYTDKEKEDLVGIVSKYVNVIENKRTDIKTIKEKNAAWEKIVKEFCALSQTGERSVAQLKMLYEGLKKKAKKDKKDMLLNSEDTRNGVKLNNISLRILSLLENRMQLEQNGFDIENIKTEKFDSPNENLQTPEFDVHFVKTEDEEMPVRPDITYEHLATNQELLSRMNKRKFSDEYYFEKCKIKIEMLNLRKEREQYMRDIKLLEKKEKEIDIMIKRECLNQMQVNHTNNKRRNEDNSANVI